MKKIGTYAREDIENLLGSMVIGTELVDKEGDKVGVVLEQDCVQRSFQLEEVIGLLGPVEDHHDHDDQGNREEVSSQELTNDVSVEYFESGVTHLVYRRLVSLTTISRFHSAKVPSWILRRASPTSHR